MNTTYKEIVGFIRSIYGENKNLSLHEPIFIGNEKKYIIDALDSTYVSSVGPYVDRFEERFADYVGSKYAIATVNGTAALHIALKLSGVSDNDEVITQPMTFVATANAISYCNAKPIFIDIDKDTLSLSPSILESWLANETFIENNLCYNKKTNNVIRACLPMHTFGHINHIQELKEVCLKNHINLIEDAAEAMGSFVGDTHSGRFGDFGIFSFNGNKIMTSGGGGMIITDNEKLAIRARDLTTTARKVEDFEYFHDEIGYNYRLPNINAALGCAQLEKIDYFLDKKRDISNKYKKYFNQLDIEYLDERDGTKSNFWLNTIIFKSKNERSDFIKYSNENHVQTRPSWRLMNKLKPYSECIRGNLDNSEYYADRLVNIPSSVVL
jgi:perosamine synthetase